MKSHINTTFLFVLIIVVGIGVYLVLKPFVVAIFIAFVISQLFNDWYKRINRKLRGRRSLASFITCMLILIILFVPLVFVSSLVVAEANDLYQTAQENNFREKAENFSVSIPLLEIYLSNEEVQQIVGIEEFNQGLKNVGGFFFKIVKQTYQGTTQFLFMTFVMFFSLYYFFKDSDKLLKKVMNISPLKNKQEKLIITKFVSISRATLKGTLVIALIQGALMTLLFLATGVKSSILWGLVTVLVSLVPMIGTILVWLPVGIVMILIGSVWQGVAIFLIGGLVVSNVDNLLRPKLIGNETSLHPLWVFLSTLGGIAMFGVAGFLLGPVIIVLFMTLLHIYEIEFETDLKKFNK
ncbi:MAG: AI-2E family transporter [Patescibacteria group bacterium]|nr:AI-2E family transporter [Patescibacteria group bacterium]